MMQDGSLYVVSNMSSEHWRERVRENIPFDSRVRKIGNAKTRLVFALVFALRE